MTASLAAFLGSAVLASGVAAVQVFPVVEFSRLSLRAAGGGQHDIYPFSVEPHRAAEMIWPGCFGAHRHPERSWLPLIPPRHQVRPWVPSLYLGGLTLALAFGGAGLRGGPPWRAWLTLIAAASVLGALGEFASPVWWARAAPALRAVLGGYDPSINHPTNRSDGGVADGDGGVYWLMAAILPGFQTFRYPGKLLTFTALAVSALAAIGWDRSGARRPARAPMVLLALSLGAFLAVNAGHDRLVRSFAAAGRDAASYFGPFDARGAAGDLRRAVAQGAIVMGLAPGAERGPPAGEPLGRAGGPDGADGRPLRRERPPGGDRPPGPLRSQAPAAQTDRGGRTAQPLARALPCPPHAPLVSVGLEHGQRRRPALDVIRWEHDTIRAKYGLLANLSYTVTGGSVEHFDYNLFFAGFDVPLDARRVTLRGAVDGQPILYYTRRGYDLWNTRYFILPMDPAGWHEGSRISSPSCPTAR